MTVRARSSQDDPSTRGADAARALASRSSGLFSGASPVGNSLAIRAGTTVPKRIERVPLHLESMDLDTPVTLNEALLSNESAPHLFRPVLERNRGGIYVGLGHEPNFDFIAAAKPAQAFLYDRDPGVVLSHALFQVAFRVCDTASEIIAFFEPQGAVHAGLAIDQYVAAPKAAARAKELLAAQATERGGAYAIARGLARVQERDRELPPPERSVFSDESKFAIVKSLARQGRMHVFAGNHGEPALFARMAHVAAQGGAGPRARVKNIYVSNATDWLYEPEGLVASLPRLPLAESARLLCTRNPAHGHVLSFAHDARALAEAEDAGREPPTQRRFPSATHLGDSETERALHWSYFAMPVRGYPADFANGAPSGEELDAWLSPVLEALRGEEPALISSMSGIAPKEKLEKLASHFGCTTQQLLNNLVLGG